MVFKSVKIIFKDKANGFFFKQKINICSTFLNQFKSTEGVLSIAIEVKKNKGIVTNYSFFQRHLIILKHNSVKFNNPVSNILIFATQRWNLFFILKCHLISKTNYN